MSWARQRRFPLPRSDKASDRSKVDRAMSQYIASLYAAGLGPSKGRLVLYGWILLHTDAEAKDRPFPRSQRVMRGFAKKTISDSKLPLPESVIFAMIDCLLDMFGWRVAVAAWLQYDTYVRTVTLLRVRFCDFTGPQPDAGVLYSMRWSLVIAPQSRGQPTKSGQFNESLTIAERASAELPQHWLARTVSRVLAHATRNGKQNALLCDFTHTEYASMLERARVQLKLPFVVTPHQFRHSGPSNDRYQARRSLPQIKARGFWKSDASVAVYEKHALLLSMLARLKPAQQRSFHAMRLKFGQRVFNAVPT